MKKVLLCVLSFALIMSNMAYAEVNTVDAEALAGVTDYVNNNYVNLSSFEKKELIDDLYNERVSHDSITTQSHQGAKTLDEAYAEMMAEENYIISLINDMDGTATLSSWEDNLNFLMNHYDDIKDNPEVNIEYVDSYVHAYKIVKKCQSLPEVKINDALTRTTYDYDAAVSYAYDWWDDHNPDYSNWDGHGGDCANFVSQCLFSGGKPMEGTDRTSASAWFSRTNSREELSKLSDTWIDAGMFRWYWQDNASAYKKFSRGGTESYNYTWPGDAISFLNNNDRAYHTLICVDYDSTIKETYMACHTSASKSRTLSTATNFIVYNMR